MFDYKLHSNVMWMGDRQLRRSRCSVCIYFCEVALLLRVVGWVGGEHGQNQAWTFLRYKPVGQVNNNKISNQTDLLPVWRRFLGIHQCCCLKMILARPVLLLPDSKLPSPCRQVNVKVHPLGAIFTELLSREFCLAIWFAKHYKTDYQPKYTNFMHKFSW